MLSMFPQILKSKGKYMFVWKFLGGVVEGGDHNVFMRFIWKSIFY